MLFPKTISVATTGLDKSWESNGDQLAARNCKAWVSFLHHDNAGEDTKSFVNNSMDIIQTLLGTAKLNGLDPAAWLKDTLEKFHT
jgi:hypothetical protein